jgi:hypothetical protein
VTDILWMDDAAGYMLQPIARMLRRRQFSLKVFTTYRSATEALEDASATSGNSFPAVIIDLLIPRAEGTLDSLEVGFALARMSAQMGSKRIVFFTVVSRSRVAVELSALEAEFPDTRFFFLEKTMGNPTELVDTLAGYVRENQ